MLFINHFFISPICKTHTHRQRHRRMEKGVTVREWGFELLFHCFERLVLPSVKDERQLWHWLYHMLIG